MPNQGDQMSFSLAMQAQALMLEGSLTKAGELLERGLKENPGSQSLLFLEGERLKRLGDYLAASTMFTACKRSPDVDHALSQIALSIGDLTAATQLLEKCKYFAPNAEWLQTEFKLLSYRGMPREAISVLDKMLKIFPNSANTLLTAGEFAWHQGQKSYAIESWENITTDGIVKNKALCWLTISQLEMGIIQESNCKALDIESAGCVLLNSLIGDFKPQIDPIFGEEKTYKSMIVWSQELLNSHKSTVSYAVTHKISAFHKLNQANPQI